MMGDWNSDRYRSDTISIKDSIQTLTRILISLEKLSMKI